MNDGKKPSSQSTASFLRAARIDVVCDRFEAVWQTGGRPSIHEFLDDVSDLDRTVLLRELLMVDLACRRCQGERPDTADYIDQFPGQTELVVEVFDQLESTVSQLDTSGPTGPWHGEQSPAGGSDSSASVGVRYQILRRHARGGLGEVFVAREEDLKREVALKQIRPDYAGDRLNQMRFIREAEITGGLGHPGIVPIFGLGRHPDGRPFYVMPFIRGHGLDLAIKRFHDGCRASDTGAKAVEFRKLLSHFLDVCQAIDYAHSQNVIHRDIKPSNIMIGQFGETLVVDWGLAKALVTPGPGNGAESTAIRGDAAPAERGETLAGSPLGTPHYMSPEQAAGRIDLLGTRTDIYSLGATLYCLLTGRAPFAEKDLTRLLEQVQCGDYEPPRRLNRSIPRALEAVCLKAMALRPDDRYPSARTLAHDIERWLADEPVSAFREPWPARLARWARRHRPLVTGMAALLVTAVVALAVSTILIGNEKRREHVQRKLAEVNFSRAREAVDQMLSEVGDIELAEVPQMEVARKRLLAKALGFYEAFVAERPADPAVQIEYGRAHERLAAIHDLLGDARQAEAAYRRSITLFEGLSRTTAGTDPPAADLARAFAGLGIILKKANRFQEAEAALRTALQLRERQEGGRADLRGYQQDLAESRYHLATLLARLPHREPEDEHVYRQAVETQQSLASAAASTPENRRKLVRYLNNLGLLLADAGRLADAEQYYRQAIKALQEELASDPLAPDNRWHMARSEANMGVLLQKSERVGEAEGYLVHARDCQKRLSRDFPRIPDYRHELASILNNLGLLFGATGREALAEQAYRESLALRERLASEVARIPDYPQKLAVTRLNLALLLESRNPLAAKQIYHQALDAQESLLSLFPDVPEYRLALGRTLYSLSGLHFKQGELAAARRLLEQAIPHHRAALEFNRRNQAGRDYLRDDYGVLTVVLVRLREHDAAAKAALELPRLVSDQATEYLRAAAFLARCVELATKDERLTAADRERRAEEYGGEATAVLRQGVQAGHISDPALLDQAGFRALINRPDFQRLRSELQQTGQGRAG
jgi:eukaryotic-like serine/threonine-protein kinase